MLRCMAMTSLRPKILSLDAGKYYHRSLATVNARWSEFELQLRGCQADDDCSYASIGDACRASCPLALNKHQLASVVSRLRDEAARYCEACAPPFDCPVMTLPESPA
jgi:hypothetical protein